VIRRPQGLALALLVVLACGDDGDGASSAIDAGRNLDSGIVACVDAGGCADQAFALVCDDGRCVECAAPVDCAASAFALGPRCDVARGYCTCAEDSDCAGNTNGPTCNPATSSCGCVRDQDCIDPRTCIVEPYLGGTVRTCQPR
jgi:hypothetical protein